MHTSSVDVNGNPTYPPVGKPITSTDIDADLAEHDKPWRRPGADQSDYFNYGFDEFTWATYVLKQRAMAEFERETKSSVQNSMEMMGMPMMPGMPGAPPTAPTGPAASQPGAQPGAGGMPGMPDEQQMMQQMMQMMNQNGITDPGQLDFNAFMQSMGGGAAGMPGMGGGN
ncbi:MAG: pre-mRNA polyadenylation factor Fip1 domain-containing protein, partial [Terriglobus roseus]|nr:pre-mRNA polyadenylation factor Fip1 domain-containing protein [Terriglobus roseus]